MARDKTKERKERKDVFLDPWMIEAIDKIYDGNGKYSEYCRNAVSEKLIRDKIIKGLENVDSVPCITNQSTPRNSRVAVSSTGTLSN